MKVAFHKGGNLIGDRIIKWWDAGIYSHCEVVFGDGLWASASFMDGQKVRGKFINPADSHWDYLTLPASYEAAARAFFTQTEGSGYDLFGMTRFIIAPLRGAGDKYWCSEWVAEALGLREPWRYGPNGLHAALSCLSPENPP